jgi:hypothetical protein
MKTVVHLPRDLKERVLPETEKRSGSPFFIISFRRSIFGLFLEMEKRKWLIQMRTSALIPIIYTPIK